MCLTREQSRKIGILITNSVEVIFLVVAIALLQGINKDGKYFDKRLEITMNVFAMVLLICKMINLAMKAYWLHEYEIAAPTTEFGTKLKDYYSMTLNWLNMMNCMLSLIVTVIGSALFGYMFTKYSDSDILNEENLTVYMFAVVMHGFIRLMSFICNLNAQIPGSEEGSGETTSTNEGGIPMQEIQPRAPPNELAEAAGGDLPIGSPAEERQLLIDLEEKGTDKDRDMESSPGDLPRQERAVDPPEEEITDHGDGSVNLVLSESEASYKKKQ